MGYACPVCETPQVDGRHLANHLAFSALTGAGDHEAWLDEHVPEWGDLGEEDLAAAVVPLATETDVADAFEAEGRAPASGDRGRVPAPELDDDAASILADAREYTRRMAEGDDIEEGSESDKSDDADSTDEGKDGKATGDEDGTDGAAHSADETE